MPYIKQQDREKFTNDIANLSKNIESEGELNYVISKLLHNYTNKKGKCYKTLNEVQGVMTCASMEFYRKIVSPYEDDKITENGDI